MKKKTTKRKTAKKATKVAKKKVVKTKTVKKAAKKKTAKKAGLTQITYGVSPELEAIVNAKKLTRPQIVKKLWVYIKAKKCQSVKNRRMIEPDAKLAKVIGNKPVDMLKLATHLNKHIKK